MYETVKVNKDNDKKFKDTIIPDKKKKKNNIEESVDTSEDTLEYFTE